MDVIEMLQQAVEKGASDLIFSVGAPPVMRLQGSLEPYSSEKLTPELTKKMIYSILTDEQKATYEEFNELDLSISIRNIGRFRINVYRQKGHVGAAFRTIMTRIPSMEQLDLPAVCNKFIEYHNGLVLVTGPTGSGKSTTLAAMLDAINETRKCHMITVEDPIEFVHDHKMCIVDQRQLGRDTLTYANALKYVLRQDPDVILVGEMRDLETIASTLTLAETGHLVFSTLHTQSAAQTIDRIIDVFPPYQQEQIRIQLSLTLKAVVAQTLMPRADHTGRVAAREIMVNTPAIANLIRESKTFMITNAIQTGRKEGMITMDDSIKALFNSRLISHETVSSHISDPRKMR